MKFAISNHVNASTKVTLFFADYGFHSQISIELSEIYGNSKKKTFSSQWNSEKIG